MSLESERKAVRTMIQQHTISEFTDLQSICRQLAQHRRRIAYGLSIFVGSGLIQYPDQDKGSSLLLFVRLWVRRSCIYPYSEIKRRSTVRI